MWFHSCLFPVFLDPKPHDMFRALPLKPPAGSSLIAPALIALYGVSLHLQNTTLCYCLKKVNVHAVPWPQKFLLKCFIAVILKVYILNSEGLLSKMCSAVVGGQVCVKYNLEWVRSWPGRWLGPTLLLLIFSFRSYQMLTPDSSRFLRSFWQQKQKSPKHCILVQILLFQLDCPPAHFIR